MECVKMSLDLPKALQNLFEISKRQVAKVDFSIIDNTWQVDKVSKIGGMGYLPIGEKYPTTVDGNPLVLLFQLNFEQLANTIDISQLAYKLPHQGILQVYIIDKGDTDDVYGRDNYEVRFWEDDKLPINQDELNKASDLLKNNIKDYCLPFSKGKQFLMQFKLIENACYDADTIEYVRLTSQIDDLKGKSISNYLEEYTGESNGGKIFDNYMNTYMQLAKNGIQDGFNNNFILGYPNFIQGDFRYDYRSRRVREYISLLQIDSERFGDSAIMWGDCGIANFLIHPDDLEKQEFGELIYDFDCG